MIRNAAMLIFSVFCAYSLEAQIIITGNDMPAPGDTIRKSLTTLLDGFDYEQSGPDQTWYFDELTVISQQVDTFVSVDETPTVYQFFFNNQWIYPDYNATMAQKLAEFGAIPGLTLSDTYLFILNDDDEYREVGYGAALEGVQVPIQLQEIDTIYRFPLEYGDVDSSHSLLEVEVPDLGYLMVSKFRRNTVDGWGTLITPYGEFQTLRVKTEINEYDSLYSDSLGFGMPVTRNIIEYKWFSNGYPGPVLTVSAEPFFVTASYMDSVRSTFLSVPDIISHEFDFSVYPNPSHGNLTVTYELDNTAEVSISLYSVDGREVKLLNRTRQAQGTYERVVNLQEDGILKGIYLVSFSIDNIPHVKKIMVN